MGHANEDRSVLKRVLLVILGIGLLVVPTIVRWLYFHEGSYRAGPVSRPNLNEVRVPAPEKEPFVDVQPSLEAGTILLDKAHDNQVEMAELNVLQARLAARGQQLEAVESSEGSSELWNKLRYAKALAVISPGETWQPEEIRMVQDFVRKGGRLLLVADPTRFEVVFDEEGTLIGLDSDVVHINDLAAQFGLVFQSDYLYNTVDNEGNYRNIRLTDLGSHQLTEGLEQLVFYAAHSIESEEPALIRVGGETRSSNRERVEDLTVATLATEGAVLALGDLTFMTEPYNESYDNDQFLANIADFLSSAQRYYELADFPYFFGDRAHLVFAGDALLQADLLASGSALQSVFSAAGKELLVRESEDGSTDTLFLGLYDQVGEVEPYLAAADVTLPITETLSLEGAPVGPAIQSPRATTTATQVLTTTDLLGGTPSAEVTPTLAVTVTRVVTSLEESRVKIGPVGELALDGTSMLFLQGDSQRYVMAVLADAESGLQAAVERLISGDLKDCLLHTAETAGFSSLAFCPTGEATPGDRAGGPPELERPVPTPKPTESVTGTVPPALETAVPEEPGGKPLGRIFVISLDDGQGRYDGMTGAYDYAGILGSRYDVTIWSKASDPPLEPSRLLDYDLVVWAAGDFEEGLGELESELLFLLVLNGTPVIVSGAYVADTDEKSVQRDLQVKVADHPLASGFQAGEVIDFVAPPSGEEYEIDLLRETAGDDSIAVFVRGRGSEDAGAPSVWVVQDEVSDVQVVFIGFPIYLLPEAAKTRLVENAVDWLLSP
jgi:hypothetical protein